MKKQILLFSILIFSVAAINLSCSLFSNLSRNINRTKSTLESAATGIHESQSLLDTAKAYATEFSQSDIMATGQALATQAKDSGFLETAQAYLTSEGSGALETMQAFVTEQGPELLQTSQAYMTEMSNQNDKPVEDIPIVQGEKTNLFFSNDNISYYTKMDFASVLAFYKNEMPNNGWRKVEQGWVETPSSAVLYYEKPDRSVSITLSINPLDNHTVVMIFIKPK